LFPEQEDFVDVNTLSFQQALDRYKEDGEPDWGTAKGTFIEHIGMIGPFGRYDVHCSGNKHIVNATGKTAGPSWRMVVELGDKVRPTGIYPGGQSGNPGSPYFDNFIDDWVEGKYYELIFGSKKELSPRAMASQTLKPE
jgi:penicillin amidase